jgi:hypothetical protein
LVRMPTREQRAANWAPGGFGVGWMRHAVPFQRSASAVVCPELSKESPVVVQADGEVQDTDPPDEDTLRPRWRWDGQGPPGLAVPPLGERRRLGCAGAGGPGGHTERTCGARHGAEDAALRPTGMRGGLDTPGGAVPPLREGDEGGRPVGGLADRCTRRLGRARDADELPRWEGRRGQDAPAGAVPPLGQVPADVVGTGGAADRHAGPRRRAGHAEQAACRRTRAVGRGLDGPPGAIPPLGKGR